MRRQAIAVGSTEALAAIAESMHNASEEVVAGLPPSQQEAAAELAKVLVGAEIRNSKKDQELVASWEEQFRQLEAANQDLARRRRLREEAISTFREDISNDYAVDLVNLLVMRHAKQEGESCARERRESGKEEGGRRQGRSERHLQE